MRETLVADVLVNLFGAAGLLVGARSMLVSDPKGALTVRVAWTLRVAAALFLARSLAWSTGSELLDRVVSAVASLLPLCALVTVEGVLRRHAPASLKVGVAGASLATFVLHLSGLLSPGHATALLMVHVLAGLAAANALILARDTSSLSGAENAAARKLAVASLLLTALAVTDFRTVLPDVPLRLGALGALVLLYVSLTPEGLATPGRTRAATLAIWSGISLALAFGFVAVQGEPDPARLARVAGVALAALILAALLSESVAGAFERGRPVSAVLLAREPDEFVRALREHPLLSDARVLQGPELADVDDGPMRAFLAARPVARRSRAPWGLPPTDPGAERAMSLLQAHDGSHLALLSLDPLRVLVACVPSTAAGPRTEGELEIACRIGREAFGTRA